MDIFIEQLIAKKTTTTDLVKKILISMAGLLVAIVIMTFAFSVQFYALAIVSVGVLYLTTKLLKKINVEYEYILTNNELDIDKIIAKEKRKRLISLNLNNTSDFSIHNPNQTSKAKTTVLATDGTQYDLYQLEVEHSKHGKVQLIFSPNKEMRESIIKSLPTAIRRNINLS